MHFISQLLSERLSGYSAAKAERLERAKLRNELESYRTDAERNELGAILSRHSAEEIARLEQASGWRAA